MPEEVAILAHRAASADDVMKAAQEYGRNHADAWGGAYVDTATGRVVALVVGDLDSHEAALRALVTPNAPLDVRSAQWTLGSLKDLAHKIATDGWIASRGYDLIGVGAHIRENLVRLQLSTADPDAAMATLDHYNARGRLEVSIDGTGVLTKQRGGVTGFAIDRTGRPVSGLDVQLQPDVPGAPTGGDIGHETDANGSFRFLNLAPVGYRINLFDATASDGTTLVGPDRVLVGTAHVDIASGQIVTVVIEVRP